MAVQVVAGDVVHLVAVAVGGGHVHLAVAEDHPHGVGRPVVHAHDLVHDGGIAGGDGLGVAMFAKGEHVHIVVQTGLVVVDDGVRHQLGLGAGLVKPIGEAHLAGGGGLEHGARHHGGGRGAADGGGGGGRLLLSVLQGLQGLLARHAVGGQLGGGLEGLHSQIGLGAVDAVGGAAQIAQADQGPLQGADRRARAAHMHGGGFAQGGFLRGLGLGGGLLGLAVVDGGQGLGAGDAVRRQAVLTLEGADRRGGLGAEFAVDGIVKELEHGQPRLQEVHLRAGGADLQGGIGVGHGGGRRGGGGRGLGGGRGAGAQGVAAEQPLLGLQARHAVGGQVVLLLEGLDGGDVVGVVDAVRGDGVVAQGHQLLLHAGDGNAAGAPAQHHHVIGGDGGGGGGDGGGNDGGGQQDDLQGVVDLAVGDAVDGQIVLLLEGLDGGHGVGVVGPVDGGLIIAQGL